MALLIRLYRITALFLWSMVIAVMSMPYQFGHTWKSKQRIGHLTHLWSKGVARIINLRVTITGRMPQASGGLVVANHLSYLDIVVHGSILPLRHTPKVDIRSWPLLGWYIGLSNPIWINRQSKQVSKSVLREFAKTMKHGIYLIVFPEGTTTDGKHGILPFKSTPFEAAITGNSPIIPVIIRYEEPAGRPTVCWYGDMLLLPHVWQALGFPSIKAHLYFLPAVFPEGRSRKKLAEDLHTLMSKHQ